MLMPPECNLFVNDIKIHGTQSGRWRMTEINREMTCDLAGDMNHVLAGIVDSWEQDEMLQVYVGKNEESSALGGQINNEAEATLGKANLHFGHFRTLRVLLVVLVLLSFICVPNVYVTHFASH